MFGSKRLFPLQRQRCCFIIYSHNQKTNTLPPYEAPSSNLLKKSTRILVNFNSSYQYRKRSISTSLSEQTELNCSGSQFTSKPEKICISFWAFYILHARELVLVRVVQFLFLFLSNFDSCKALIQNKLISHEKLLIHRCPYITRASTDPASVHQRACYTLSLSRTV